MFTWAKNHVSFCDLGKSLEYFLGEVTKCLSGLGHQHDRAQLCTPLAISKVGMMFIQCLVS